MIKEKGVEVSDTTKHISSIVDHINHLVKNYA